MIDRLQFMHKLEVKDQDFAQMVISQFDQLMALYSICGHYENLDIQNEMNLTFTVSLNNPNDIATLQNAIISNNCMIQIYDRCFRININSVTNTTINITIS